MSAADPTVSAPSTRLAAAPAQHGHTSRVAAGTGWPRSLSGCPGLVLGLLEALCVSFFCLGVLIFQAGVWAHGQTSVVNTLGVTTGGGWHQAVLCLGSVTSICFAVPVVLLVASWRLDVSANRFGRWCFAGSLSRFGRGVLLYKLAGFAALVLYQLCTGQWFFSLRNFALRESAGGSPPDPNAADFVVDWSRFLVLVLQAPLTEELVFRAGAFYAALSRSGRVGWATAVSSSLFAAVHLLNVLNRRYGAAYISVQVVFGLCSGVFLCLRFAVTGSLVECCILHIVNNALAVFIAADGTVSFTEPSKLLPLLHTFVFYIVCSGLSYRQLCRTPTAKLHALHPILDSAPIRWRDPPGTESIPPPGTGQHEHCD